MGKRGPKPQALVLGQVHLDILHLLALGNGSKEIAETTGWDYFWVKDRQREIYRLLNARNAAQACAIGVRDGLISGGAT